MKPGSTVRPLALTISAPRELLFCRRSRRPEFALPESRLWNRRRLVFLCRQSTFRPARLSFFPPFSPRVHWSELFNVLCYSCATHTANCRVFIRTAEEFYPTARRKILLGARSYASFASKSPLSLEIILTFGTKPRLTSRFLAGHEDCAQFRY